MVAYYKKLTIHLYTGDILDNKAYSLDFLINALVVEFKNGEDNHQPQIILKSFDTNELYLITITNSHKFRIVPYKTQRNNQQ